MGDEAICKRCHERFSSTRVACPDGMPNCEMIHMMASCGCDALGPPDAVDAPLPDYDIDPTPGPPVSWDDGHGIEALRREVAARWGSSAYGPAYLERRDPQRDAHHALLHVTKATGKLAGLLDDLDHAPSARMQAEEARGDARKMLADLVICAARIAEAWPNGAIDLGRSVADRLAAKFPPKGGA